MPQHLTHGALSLPLQAVARAVLSADVPPLRTVHAMHVPQVVVAGRPSHAGGGSGGIPGAEFAFDRAYHGGADAFADMVSNVLDRFVQVRRGCDRGDVHQLLLLAAAGRPLGGTPWEAADGGSDAACERSGQVSAASATSAQAHCARLLPSSSPAPRA